MTVTVAVKKRKRIDGDNPTNIVGAELEFEEFVAAWNKKRIEEPLSHWRTKRDNQTIRSTSFRMSSGTIDKRLQQNNAGSVRE